jgi:DNA-directed RNA polymerase subunit RPC12/RpoP
MDISCDYCNEQDIKNVKETDFEGMDGIMYDKKDNKYYLVIEHFRREINKVEINNCPQCGRKLI